MENQKKKVLLIKGASKYNVLRYACDLFAKGFEANHYEVVIYDAYEIKTNTMLIKILKKELTGRNGFVFLINGTFCELRIEKNDMPLLDCLPYKVFAYFVDYPYYQSLRLEKFHGNNYFTSFVDKNHVEYVKTYYKNIKHVSFIPHFGFPSCVEKTYDQKNIDIFFPGSYYGTENIISEVEEFPKVWKDIVYQVLDMLLRDVSLTVEAALKQYFESIFFDYTDNDFLDMMDLMVVVDRYIREHYRYLVIKSILDSNLCLTVTGSGWDSFREQYPNQINILTKDGMDIEETIKTIADSKIVLNVLPTFKCGTHERIFTSMMNGSVCVADKNKLLEELFTDGEEIIFYDMKCLDELPVKIKEILSNQEKAEKMVRQAKTLVSEEYSFQNLARKVIDIVEND